MQFSVSLHNLLRDRSSLDLSTTGRPEIYAGVRLRVQRIAERVDGIWEVSHVGHPLGDKGRRTHTEASAPDLSSGE